MIFLTVLALNASQFDDDASKTVRPIKSFFNSSSVEAYADSSLSPSLSVEITQEQEERGCVRREEKDDQVEFDEKKQKSIFNHRSISSTKLNMLDEGNSTVVSNDVKSFAKGDAGIPASEITPHLYLGCKKDAESLDVLRALGITHILNCTKNCVNNCFEDNPDINIIYKRYDTHHIIAYLSCHNHLISSRHIIS